MTETHRGKRVLITGGTGSVGQALIEEFCLEGYTPVFQHCSNDVRANEPRLKHGIDCWKLDFLSDFSLPHAEFDVVLNNAAINICDEQTVDVPIDAWRKTLRVNLDAPFRIIQACLPWMIAQGWGRIVNISSIYGLRGTEDNLPYTVSKHGLSGLTKTVAHEYADRKITCNEICPGPIQSELMERIAKRDTSDQGPTLIDEHCSDFTISVD
ncbi:MAG: SDR family NAD(P)-dependent oxidoreductase [Planctomycetota bacterium]|nr:SDR family NAD(P)-dependent oxidoreductase [Planctomycetota bacterium]